MKRSTKWIVFAIVLSGGGATLLWYGVNDWKTPQVQRPRVGPEPGYVEMRSDFVEPQLDARPSTASVQRRSAQSAEGVVDASAKRGSDWRVVDERGRAVPYAELRPLTSVWVHSTGESWAEVRDWPQPTALADDDGFLRPLVSLPSGRYVCTRDRFQPRLLTVDEGVDRERVLTLRRALGSPLLVVDSEAEPIAGARLLLPADALGWSTTVERGAFFDVARSDSHGEIALWNDLVPHSSAMIVCSGYSPGYFSIPRPLADEPLRVTLRPAAVVEGIVRGTEGVGAPVGVLAECPEVSLPSMLHLPIAHVGEDGRFRMESLAAGLEWTLVPCVRLGREWKPAGPPVRTLAPAGTVELALASGSSLSVRALDASGHPLEVDVLTSLFPREELARSDDPLRETDPDGRTFWPRLAWPFGESTAIEAELWLACDGYANVRLGTVELTAGGHRDLGEVVFEAAESWEVEVVLANDGEPVGGALVEFLPTEMVEAGHSHSLAQGTTTNANGIARLMCTQGTPGWLTARTERGYRAAILRNEASDCSVVRLELAPPTVLAVRCTTVQGDPVPRTRLRWRTDTLADWRAVTAGDDGIAEFDVVEGDLWIQHAPGALEGRAAMGGTLSFDVHDTGEGEPRTSQEVPVKALRAGERREVELIVPAMSELSVRVTIDGLPGAGCLLVGVPGMRLDLIDNDLWGSMNLPKALVPADGLAMLPGLPLGTIMLSASLPETHFVDYMVIEVLRQIDGPVPMMLETGTRRIVVLDREGQPVAGAEVVLRQRSHQQGLRAPLFRAASLDGSQRVESRPLREATALSSASGAAEFARVPLKGRFEAALRDTSRFPLFAPVSLDAAGRGAVLRDGSGAALRLRLTRADHTPASGVEFVLRGGGSRYDSNGTTGAEGEIAVGGLTPGDYRLWYGDHGALELRLEPGVVFEDSVLMGG